MTSPWIDFKELRSKLRFADVLQRHGVTLKVKGEKATGFCPLPNHPRHDGKRHSPSFSANLSRGIFQCFGCGAKGNALDFEIRMLNLDPSNPQHVRQVAVALSEQLNLTKPGCATAADSLSTAAREKSPEPAHENAGQVSNTCPAIVNAPLDFELRGLDPSHPYLKERGFTSETIAHFGLGYCSRGLLQGRVAIPIHDHAGQLMAYAGRLVDEAAIGADRPKYKFPPARERDGKRYEFHKSLCLYNGFGVGQLLKDLIVVEGFPSVWCLWQAGFSNVVALMGSSCSTEQAALIARIVACKGRIWLMPDGDDAGTRCAQSVLAQVAPHCFVHWARLSDGRQPTDCSEEELKQLLTVK